MVLRVRKSVPRVLVKLFDKVNFLTLVKFDFFNFIIIDRFLILLPISQPLPLSPTPFSVL